jgi:hypothetical protein
LLEEREGWGWENDDDDVVSLKESCGGKRKERGNEGLLSRLINKTEIVNRGF